jgi:hypothetical protein
VVRGVCLVMLVGVGRFSSCFVCFGMR